MKRGFTILELLVASILLSMLVTMLTMMFNQSSVAWQTGSARVSDMSRVRAKMGGFHDIEDNILPGVNQPNAKTGAGDNRQLNYRIVSPWITDGTADNTLRLNNRLVEQVSWGQVPSFTISQAMKGDVLTAGTSSQNGNAGANKSGDGSFVVGVRSAGPDRRWDTGDEINTFPEDVN